VRAEYTPIVDSSNNLKAINVRNYSNRDKVNGPAVGTSGAGGSFPGRFIANIPNAEDPSKLNVGFALGESNTSLVGAPYWVVAIDEENYEWAIITGGAPTQESGDGKCITDGGFWFFTRKPVDPESTAKTLEVAEGLGLDSAKLVTVPQEGCLYEGA
jgi:lipocalin